MRPGSQRLQTNVMFRLWLLACVSLSLVHGFAPFRNNQHSQLSRRSLSLVIKPISSFSSTTPFSSVKLQANTSNREGGKRRNLLSRGREGIRTLERNLRGGKKQPLKSKLTIRTFLLSAAFLLVSCFINPSIALAMGGGMGGPKGPIVPMTRYGYRVSCLKHQRLRR
jgi:hypothetical protein